MEERKSKWLRQREFGYAKIVWEIENCFCKAYRKKWKICSPEFSVNGFRSIKWKLALQATEITDEEYLASIYIERLASGDISTSVRVFWNLSFLFGRERMDVGDREGIFDAKGFMSSRIKNFMKIQERIQRISTNKFNVEVVFLVTSTEDKVSLEKSSNIGLRTLSQELSVIYNLKDYNDLTICMGKYSVKGHKAIFSTGNKLLKDVINASYGRKKLYLGWTNNKSAESVFRYLYTGNLAYVLRMPSILIDKAINYFGVKELKQYYMKDEVILRTKSEAKEFYYKWEINDIFSDNNSVIFSPHFGARDLNITFRFRLELNDIFARTGFASIFLAASAFPQEFRELFIIFEIVDIFGHSVNKKKSARWSLDDSEELKFENFLSGDILRSVAHVGNGSLCIISTIFIPTDSVTSSVIRNRMCLLPYLNYEEHYNLLSKRIESLLDRGIYSDLRIRCGTRWFFVHTFILSARSPVFARAIRVLGNRMRFSVGDCEPEILRIVFVYIYSGVLKDYNLSDVSKIYHAAVKFGMLILKYQCAKILEDNLQISNVFDTLFLANEHKEMRLKFSAFKYILHNRGEIRQQDNWKKFISESSLYEEFKWYAKRFIKNNPDERVSLEGF